MLFDEFFKLFSQEHWMYARISTSNAIKKHGNDFESS